MKYRIKIVENIDGEKVYYAQYLSNKEMWWSIILATIFFYITMPYFLLQPKNIIDFTFYENIFLVENASYSENEMFCEYEATYKFESEEKARQAIDMYTEKIRKKERRNEEFNAKIKSDKKKKVSYIQIN